MYDMMVRKKVLKIQERLGMRLGVAYGTSKVPVIKTTEQALEALRELYKVGLRAFVLPREMFSGISTGTDLYKAKYGDLLKIRELASKFNIELSLRNDRLPEQPDDMLNTFLNVMSIMDARAFSVQPNFYSNMPQEQAMKLVIYKINEITTNIRTNAKIGVENTGKMNEVGSFEDMVDIVKRTSGTEPIVNWAHIHARGSGSLRSQGDFERIMQTMRREFGPDWMQKAFFIFSGVSYGPSGMTRQIPIEQSDLEFEHLIRASMAMNLRGTIILDTPEKEKYVVKNLERISDMVR
jgi:endonuclease IV